MQAEEISEDVGVLQIEELITTLGSATAVGKALLEKNPKVQLIPVIGTLIHRPAVLPVSNDGPKIVAVIEKQVSAWDPSECPYCKVGSKRVKPKTNWAELTA